jgi:hypothetical protein
VLVLGLHADEVACRPCAGTGSTFAGKYGHRDTRFDIACEVTASEPSRILGVRSTVGPFAFASKIEPAPNGAGTRASRIRSTRRGPGLPRHLAAFALGGPLVRCAMAHRLGKGLGPLKAVVEEAAAPGPP